MEQACVLGYLSIVPQDPFQDYVFVAVGFKPWFMGTLNIPHLWIVVGGVVPLSWPFGDIYVDFCLVENLDDENWDFLFAQCPY